MTNNQIRLLKQGMDGPICPSVPVDSEVLQLVDFELMSLIDVTGGVHPRYKLTRHGRQIVEHITSCSKEEKEALIRQFRKKEARIARLVGERQHVTMFSN